MYVMTAALPSPSPPFPLLSCTVCMATALDTTPSRMEAAEIEMLVDDEDENGSRSFDGRPWWTRRRRLIFVTLILIAVAIGIAVGFISMNRHDGEDLESKPNTQATAQQDNSNNNAFQADEGATNTAPPTSAPTLSPTALRTPSPTLSPTLLPTASPTAFPTTSAVAQPTGALPTTLSGGSPLPTPSPTVLAATASSDTSGLYAEWYNANVSLSSGLMYEVIDQIPHDATAFTQGLTFMDGRLFESTGLYGQSTIRELKPATGEVLMSVPLDSQYFAEGLAYVDGKLIQITWRKATAFVWDANDLTIPPQVIQYKTTKRNEGWGITHDPVKNELIVSDGSANLIFWNVNTLESNRTMAVVRLDGSPASYMNELEFWRGRVLANVWYEDVLLVIHPETGIVEKEYDFSKLWPKNEQPSGTDVFNGISISEDPDILYVTGKLWNRMYRIKLLP